MRFVLNLLWFIIFIKQLLFWLWLWQLKEYHLGRFRAHFEGQKFKKIISSFWRQKYPKFTKKIIVIFFTTIMAEIFLLFYFFLLRAIVLTIFFIPLLVLSFQIPSFIWRKIIINKAKAKRAKFKNLLVIGITGSYGKTSTKEFLAEILSKKFTPLENKKLNKMNKENKSLTGFNVLKTKEHQNSEIGISLCILNDLKLEHEIFVVEMAAYNKGGIKLLCDIVKPMKIGIITGVNEQHLSTFGSMENLLSAEGGIELIESLPSDGIAFFNARNKYCLELYQKTKIKKFLYGENAAFTGQENILGAIEVAKELGMTDEEISHRAEKIKEKVPGIEIKKNKNGLTIIDASYSANPTGVMAHLEYLKTFPGKKIIVMPCLIELGSATIEVHKRVGEKIGEVCDLAIITTKDRFKEIKEVAGEKAIFMENPKEIFEKIKSFCLPGDTVLLESRVANELKNLWKFEK